MSRLLAISFDCPTTPSLTLGKSIDTSLESQALHGWGIAWYPDEDYAAAVIKDSQTKSRSLVTQVFSHWKHFNSTIMICNLRGASKRTSQQDTQPFIRTYAGRDWIFTHNGDLDGNYRLILSLGNQPVFEPMGITDSEHIFCWLLIQIHQANARSLADVDYAKIQEWLSYINQLGTANIMLSDGSDLIIYQDQNLFNPLYWTRKHPPHQQTVFQSATTRFEIDDSITAHKTFVLVTTYESFSNECRQLDRAQMLVIRRGSILWDNYSNQPQVATQLPHEPGTPNVQSPVIGEEPPEELLTTQQSKKPRRLDSVFTNEIIPIHRLKISHITTYNYKKPVELSKHSFRLFPLQDRHQKVAEYELTLSTDCESETFDDVFGNRLCYASIENPYTELVVSMHAIVDIHEQTTTHYSQLHTRQQIPLSWMPWQRQMMLPYLLPMELPESQLSELIDYAMSFVQRNDYDVFSLLCDMNKTIHHDFSYLSGSTNIETTPFEVYVNHTGVCQDFANLFICLARLLNIPARYRVGYIYTGADYENKIQSEASHAWAEVYLPWLGWCGFDPTNGCLANKDHIRVASGRNYSDATPTSGTIYKGGGEETLKVEVKVEVVDETKDETNEPPSNPTPT